jgi:hypothetical protein
MLETADRTRQCALFERYDWIAGDRSERTEALPSNWRFSQQRIQQLLDQQAGRPIPLTPMASVAVAQAEAVLTA